MAFKKKVKKSNPKLKPAESSESGIHEPPAELQKVDELGPLHGLDAEQAALFASTMSETKLKDIASIYNTKVRGKSGKAFHTLPKAEKSLWYKFHQTLTE